MMYVSLTCAVSLAAVFGHAGLGKARDRKGFEKSIRDLDWFPPGVVPTVARSVAAMELLVVLAFAASPVAGPKAAVVGFSGALTLLIGFTGVIVLALKRGVRARCNCFGTAGAEYSLRHVVRNSLLAGMAVTGVLTVGADHRAHISGMTLAILTGLIIAGLTVAMDDLLGLFRM
ncbi:MauE/DoxX family redox-associated membrane protein [Streptosporangium jomthongense]|uniref:MauE/DoxX family redox-associated membrane protein n=1 Tax=Streptosporangium jomthongense TaxID=1193683 RepID=A0ABV8EWA9_9ACTN